MVYTGDDFYCDVAIPRNIPLRVIMEDDKVLAYVHTKPYWQIHYVVVPKEHISSFTAFSRENAPMVLATLIVARDVARMVEEKYGAAAILTNVGQYQDSKHLHFHVYYGAKLR